MPKLITKIHELRKLHKMQQAELAELVKLGFCSLIRIVAFILIGIGAADIILFILGKLRTTTQENE